VASRATLAAGSDVSHAASAALGNSRGSSSLSSASSGGVGSS